MGNPPGGAPEEAWGAVTWTGLQEAGLAAELVRWVPAPSSWGRSSIRRWKARPRPQLWLQLLQPDQGASPQSTAGAQVGQAQRGSHRSRAFRTPPLPLGQIHTTAVLIRAILAGQLQVATPLARQALPTVQLSWLGEQGALEAPSPDRAMVGTVKGSVLAAHEVAWGSA